MDQVRSETAIYVRLKERLLAEYDDLDEATLADTLEGITELNEVVCAAIRSALQDEAWAGVLKNQIDALRFRRDRFLGRAQQKRQACADALEAAGLKKILQPDLTISLRAGSPRLNVIAPDKIPPAFWRTPEPVLSKRNLIDALKGGVEIEGAFLSDPVPSLSVRVK